MGEGGRVLPARGHQGGVGGIAAVQQGRPRLHVQGDVALELDRAGEVAARRKVDGAPAGGGAGGDGVGDGRRVVGLAVGDGAVIQHIEGRGGAGAKEGAGETEQGEKAEQAELHHGEG